MGMFLVEEQSPGQAENVERLTPILCEATGVFPVGIW